MLARIWRRAWMARRMARAPIGASRQSRCRRPRGRRAHGGAPIAMRGRPRQAHASGLIWMTRIASARTRDASAQRDPSRCAAAAPPACTASCFPKHIYESYASYNNRGAYSTTLVKGIRDKVGHHRHARPGLLQLPHSQHSALLSLAPPLECPVACASDSVIINVSWSSAARIGG